jgi:hypothetical protein
VSRIKNKRPRLQRKTEGSIAMRLVNSGEAKCPLVYGNGECRVRNSKAFLTSVGSYVSAYIWERNLHGGYNPYGKSISVGAFGHILNSCGVKNVNEKLFSVGC